MDPAAQLLILLRSAAVGVEGVPPSAISWSGCWVLGVGWRRLVTVPIGTGPVAEGSRTIRSAGRGPEWDADPPSCTVFQTTRDVVTISAWNGGPPHAAAARTIRTVHTQSLETCAESLRDSTGRRSPGVCTDVAGCCGQEVGRMRWPRLAAVAAAVTLAVAGCGAPDTAVTSPPAGTSPVTGTPGAVRPAPTAVPTAPSTANPPPTAAASSAAAAAPDKALVVVEENHSHSSVLSGMPYLASLADTYGQTRTYQAVADPSLPNYLAIIAGSTFG